MSIYRFIIILCVLLLAACSNESSEEPKKTTKHIWQGQVDMLDEAKAVEAAANETQRLKEERLKNME